MGMFDTVITNFSKIPQGEFQTKSLACTLATYEIRENGRIYRLTMNSIEEEAERDQKIIYSIDEEDELLDITAEIYLSGFDAKDYVATFENGRLMKFRHAFGEF